MLKKIVWRKGEIPYAILGKTKATLNLLIYKRPLPFSKNMRATENHVLQKRKTIFPKNSKLPRRRKRAKRKARYHTRRVIFKPLISLILSCVNCTVKIVA